MERPDVPQTLTPPPGLQTLATGTPCFRGPSPVPPPQPQNLDSAASPVVPSAAAPVVPSAAAPAASPVVPSAAVPAVPSAVSELGLELSLNLPSQATGNLEHEFINFGDGGGDQIGSGMDVFSIFGDDGEAPTPRGVDLFAIFGDEEEVAAENADAVMNSVEDGEGAVAGSRSDAFMLFGDEEGAAAAAGSGFDTAMLFEDVERAATETGMQAEGDTPMDGLNTIVDAENVGRADRLVVAENVGRADRLVVADSTGDALDSSETYRPEITNNRKKRSSMANLVIETDLGMDGLGNEEGIAEMKHGERNEVHDLGDVGVAGMEVEGTVSTQRARKKSKYLSPPYTNPSWSEMQAALHGDAHALVPWSPKKGKASNDKISPSATCASVDLNVFLSDLLSLAVNNFHLKGSRSQRTFWNFYQEFRSSQYLCLDLGDDKVHPVDSETLARGVGDCSKVKATRTSNKEKGGAVPEAATSLNLNLGKVRHGSATLKKKATKNEVDGQGPLNLATGSANSLLGKRKANANASGMPIPESTTHDPFEFSEGDSPKKTKSNGAALAVIPLNSRDPSGLPEGGQTESNQSGQKMGTEINKKGKSSASITGKGSSGGTSEQKQMIEKALSECPAEIIITFSPGSTLPTRDEVVSILSLYGDLIEPETELREDSCSVRVVFAKGRDAEKALNSPTKKTAFRSPLTGCRLRYLLENMPGPSVSRPVKKNLQPVKRTPHPGPSVAQPIKRTPSPPHPGPSVAQPIKRTPSPGPSEAQPVMKTPSPVKKTPSPSSSVAHHVKRTPSPVKKTPSPSPSVAQPVMKTPSPGPSVVQPVRKTPRPVKKTVKETPSPGPSVAQPAKKSPCPSRLVAERFKKTPLPNIRKNLERLHRSLIGPFSVGQAAGTAEWMKLEGMEELVGDMKALLEKIDGILTQPPPATSH